MVSFPVSGVVAVFSSFFVTFFLTPWFINYFRRIGLVDVDAHKRSRPVVPTSAGVPAASGFVVGILVYIFFKTFVTHDVFGVADLFASLSSILIITFVGFLDDLNTRRVFRSGHKGLGFKEGIKQWQKPLLTLPAALPLMVVGAGDSSVLLPFFGVVDFGLLYPLLLIPLGVVGASNMVNLVGGFNGLEAGMGVIYTGFLGLFSYFVVGNPLVSAIFLVGSASLLAVLFFNFFPAKILSGDSIQYLMGGIVASGVIIGGLEVVGFVVMLPFVIEFFLKLRRGLNATSLGKLRFDGSLAPPYGRSVFSWSHLVMNLFRVREWELVLFMWFVQLVFCFFGLVVGLFLFGF